MIFLRRPNEEVIRAFLVDQAPLRVSYASMRSATPPAAFDVDHTRVRLAAGEKAFAVASDALRQWQEFQLGWVTAIPDHTPIKEGEVVAVLARVLGIWWLNACRIVEVVDDDGAMRRFGFTYATLPGHVECGQERFMIEWDKRDGTVWYDVLALSRPGHWLVRLGYPIARRIQRRFARESAAAMVRAVQGACGRGE
jgi:uncharacterized protein (UPF0548 family)